MCDHYIYNLKAKVTFWILYFLSFIKKNRKLYILYFILLLFIGFSTVQFNFKEQFHIF